MHKIHGHEILCSEDSTEEEKMRSLETPNSKVKL